MKIKEKFYSRALALTVLLLFLLIFISFVASAVPYAYIRSEHNTVSVIDTANNTVTANISLGGIVYEGVAVSPDGKKVYVAIVTPYDGRGSVSVIDTATNNVIRIVSAGQVPRGVAVNPDGSKVYTANSNDNTVSVIDTATYNLIATVNVGSIPYGIAVSPDGKNVYVTNYGGKTVSVINTANNRVTDNVDIMGPAQNRGLLGIAVNPAGTKVYVAVSDYPPYGDGMVSVIDTAKNTVTSRVFTPGNHPRGIAVTPDGKKVYVTSINNNHLGTVYVIDTRYEAATAEVHVGQNPFGVAVTPDGKKVYVLTSEGVYVIDTTNNTVTATIPVKSTGSFGQFIGPFPISTTVTSPKGGENWQAGTIKEINWNYTGSFGSLVKIELLKGEKSFSIISNSSSIGTNGTGSYNWSIPSNQTPGNDYKVKISSISNPECSNSSAGNFTILPLPPCITVTYPKGGENWQAGTTQEISWNYTGDPGNSVKIELLKGESFDSIISNSTDIGDNGTGSFSWSIPVTQTPGTNFKVKISSINNPEYNDLSSGNFSISSPPVSSITVISPKVGDNWKAGTSHEINWEYTGYPGTSVRIELFKGGAFDSIIGDSTIGTNGNGSLKWSIPSSQRPGSNYEVKISSIDNPEYKSITGNFSISSL